MLVSMTTTYPIFFPHSNHSLILPWILCLYPWQLTHSFFSTGTTYPSCPAFCVTTYPISPPPPPPQQPFTHLALHFVLVSTTTYPIPPHPPPATTYPSWPAFCACIHDNLPNIPPPPPSNHLPILPCILCLYAWQLTQYPPPQQPLTHLALHFVLVSTTYPISPPQQLLTHLAQHFVLVSTTTYPISPPPPPPATTYPSCPAFCACIHDNLPNIPPPPPQQPLTHLAQYFVLVSMTTYPISPPPPPPPAPATTYPSCPAFCACIHDNLPNIPPPPTPATTYPSCPAFRACMHDNNDLSNIFLPQQQPLTHLALHFVLVSSQLVQLFFGKVRMWDRHVNTQSLDAGTTKVMCDHDVGVICVHNSLLLKQ